MSAPAARAGDAGITALLGPTNTGKTHRAVAQMLRHRSGMIGLPLRLLAREVYDRVTREIGESRVALVTGEEKRVPLRPRYWVCTVESMPLEREVDFVAVDEIQLAAHRQRGHTFTDRLLNLRGREETWFLGSDTMRPMVERLLPTAGVASHPRFSKLSYTGVSSIGSLPPRTAVVAFSIPEVYQLAEQLRARHGGTAVVLGALSPRTRNAQVAMYEAGEVQYMVATDAIGMGLNLDVDRVVFAGLSKFDGWEMRPLETAELAQIAGRAGRYTKDGGFGVLRPLQGLDAKTAVAIEQHEFAPVRRLVWRNSDLDFSSVDALIESLRRRPTIPGLRLVERAEDYEALVSLSKRDEVRRLAREPEAVELLWDVCRIPDFRKLLLESHVDLLAQIFGQLRERGRLDPEWMAKRIDRLRPTDGDIETLMNRIAFIRTWTYISNYEPWVEHAEYWQALTREIEDLQSDALHERLTEKFVERSGASLGRRSKGRGRPLPRSAPARGERFDPAHPFSALADLELPDESDQPEEAPEAWIEELVDARHADFELDDAGRLHLGERRVAKLGPGSDVLHPDVVLDDVEGLSRGARTRASRRLSAWAKDLLAEILGPLDELELDGLSPAGRGLAYQLRQGLGTVDARLAFEQVRALTPADRTIFADRGIELGLEAVFVSTSLRTHAIRHRAALWGAFRRTAPPRVPSPGAVSLRTDESTPVEYYRHIGFLVRGPRAIRADQLERARQLIEASSSDGSSFELPASLASWLGCRQRQVRAVVRALGYQPDAEGRWRASTRGGRRRRSSSR